jgi:aminoglycoside phosphotransferase (APT) family kinase protein
VDTASPALSVVVRQFPAGDSAGAHEERVLRTLDRLGGLAPVLLDSDLAGRWSRCPTTLISWLDGQADITPGDPDAWARQLGQALATVHEMPSDRLSSLPSVFDRSGGSREALHGPLATRIRSGWSRITASPDVLTHSDYWSGNVVWRDGVLTGIVDWSGGVRGPRGYDLGWCRLDLYLLFGDRVADVFLAAYEGATGEPVLDVALWDGWAAARSHHTVETWEPNYRPLGRPDLDRDELRRRHSQWTSRLVQKA